MEFKWLSRDDAFCEEYIVDGTTRKSFVHDVATGYDTLGQITAYSAAQLGAQYRTHIFSVLIVRDKARLLRWDRSGTIVTEAFQYNQTPHLTDFFRRFGAAPLDMRGRDLTVSIPTPEAALAAQEAFGLDSADSLLCLKVSDRLFVVEPPVATAYTPPGRATRGSRAWDIEGNRQVYLKDSWRVDLPDFDAEGVTYQTLMHHGVEHIAECLASGDVGGSDYHATKTQLYVESLCAWACPTVARLIPHRHYRLVLDIIGRPLTMFNSTRELVECVRDALIGKQPS